MSRPVRLLVLAAVSALTIGSAHARGGHNHGGHRTGHEDAAPVYVIIEEPETTATMARDAVPADGHLLVDSSSPSALVGAAPRRLIVIAFDRKAEVNAWEDSPAYKGLIAASADRVQILSSVGLRNAATFMQSGTGPDAVFNSLPADKNDKADTSVSNSVPDICKGC